MNILQYIHKQMLKKWRRPPGLCGCRLSSKTRNPTTSPRVKQLMWLRIVHSRLMTTFGATHY